MNENWLDRLEERFGRYRINDLMEKIVLIMALVYVIDFFCVSVFHFSIMHLLTFDRYAIMHGQIWRLITFVFVPAYGSLISVILGLYLNYVIGRSLENEWGTFKFNVFYFSGILATIIGGMITGYATNNFLNLSLFLAFACIYPDFELLLFYILPIKIKYLALLDVLGLVMMFISGNFASRIALVISLLNVLVFCFGALKTVYKNYQRRREWQNNFRDL